MGWTLVIQVVRLQLRISCDSVVGGEGCFKDSGHRWPQRGPGAQTGGGITIKDNLSWM